MESFTLGAGLAAIAFWGFIATTVIGGMWYSIREKDAKHETVRRMVESGQPIDQQMMDKLLALGDGKSTRLDRDFMITSLILLPAAAGLAIFAMLMGAEHPDAQAPLLGAAALAGCIGLGFLLASKIAARWYRPDNDISI